MKKQFSSTLIGATLLISATGLVSKGIGFIREILYANYFGLRTEFDIYLVSAALPMLISTMLLYLGQNFFIPAFNRIDFSEDKKRKNYFIKTFWFFFLFGILLTIILLILSNQIIIFSLQDFSDEKIKLAIIIFRLFVLSIPFSSLISIISAYQQANFQYKAPALSQLVVNITLVLLVVLFNNDFGIVIIPIALLVGTFLQFIYLFLKIDVSVEDMLKPLNFKFDKFFIPFSFWVIICIELIGQLYNIADRYFINQIEPGGIAALNYSMNLVLLPISIFSFAISTAMFPKLSENFASDSTIKLQTNFNLSLLLNLTLFIPITIILFFYGSEIISLLFQHGNFNEANSKMAFEITKILALSLIFYSSYGVANKLIYSINQTKKLLWLTISGLILKIVLNIILVEDFQQNGLAGSTAISYLFFFVGSMFIIEKSLKIESHLIFIKEIFLLIVNGVLAFGISKYIMNELLLSVSLSNVIEAALFVILFYFNLICIRHQTVQVLNSFRLQYLNRRN